MKRRQIKIAAGILMTALLVSGCQSNSKSEESATSKVPETVTEAPQETEEATENPIASATPAPTEEAAEVPMEETGGDDQKTDEEEPAAANEESAKASGEDSTAETNGDNKAQVQVYAGSYIDEAFYDPDFSSTACVIEVSNVTENSFDFAVYEEESADTAKNLIFKTHTATFLSNGIEAVYEGAEYTLHFTFPDYHSAYPAATDMEVTGFAPLEGHSYSNGSIPGHTFG